MTRLICLISIVLMTLAPSVVFALSHDVECRRATKEFLLHPDRDYFSTLTSSKGEECWRIFGGSNADLNKLLLRVREGNYWAARYVAINLKLLGGGNLEDALVALGDFSESDMSDFLRFLNDRILSEQQVSDALTMLSPSLDEAQSVQLSIMRSRERMVMAVKCPELSKEKAFALREIRAFMDEVKSSR